MPYGALSPESPLSHRLYGTHSSGISFAIEFEVDPTLSDAHASEAFQALVDAIDASADITFTAGSKAWSVNREITPTT